MQPFLARIFASQLSAHFKPSLPPHLKLLVSKLSMNFSSMVGNISLFTASRLTNIERARKVNICVFTFLFGVFIGPMMSSFLLSKISWKFDMVVLAIFYGVSAILVALCGEETLYNCEKGGNPASDASRISLLIGIAGWKAKGHTTMLAASKHLIRIGIKPQLFLPRKTHLSVSYSYPVLTLD